MVVPGPGEAPAAAVCSGSSSRRKARVTGIRRDYWTARGRDAILPRAVLPVSAVRRKAARQTRKICNVLLKQIAIQSGCDLDHCTWLISASAR